MVKKYIKFNKRYKKTIKKRLTRKRLTRNNYRKKNKIKRGGRPQSKSDPSSDPIRRNKLPSIMEDEVGSSGKRPTKKRLMKKKLTKMNKKRKHRKGSKSTEDTPKSAPLPIGGEEVMAAIEGDNDKLLSKIQSARNNVKRRRMVRGALQTTGKVGRDLVVGVAQDALAATLPGAQKALQRASGSMSLDENIEAILDIVNKIDENLTECCIKSSPRDQAPDIDVPWTETMSWTTLPDGTVFKEL